MHEVTRILSDIHRGDPQASEQLLPLVYDQLRRLAAEKLAHEKPGQTLQPTALVHEAYLRLVATPNGKPGQCENRWNGRGHFYAAAAEAMRRILVENARRKKAHRRGGDRRRISLESAESLVLARSDDELLAVDKALAKLVQKDCMKAELVKLHYFAGLTMEETALALNISAATAYRWWNYARAFLYQEITNDNESV